MSPETSRDHQEVLVWGFLVHCEDLSGPATGKAELFTEHQLCARKVFIDLAMKDAKSATPLPS